MIELILMYIGFIIVGLLGLILIMYLLEKAYKRFTKLSHIIQYVIKYWFKLTKEERKIIEKLK